MASKGKKKSSAHKANISKGQIGRRHPPEICAKISAIAIARSLTPEGKAHLSSIRKGKTMSEDARIRIAAKLANRVFSKEHRFKLSQSAYGRVLDETTKQKISKRKLVGHKRWPRFDYAGTRFRSTWEVFVAKAFDARGIRWQYEPRHFPVAKAMGYRPDFYLPDFDCFWEIKGWWSPKSRNKIKLFRERYPEISLIVATKDVITLLDQRFATEHRSRGISTVNGRL